jgi:magnesium-transporting ATPase (P-type)
VFELAKPGVSVTRLSAIDEAAGTTVCCGDNTGATTKNRVAVARAFVRSRSVSAYDESSAIGTRLCSMAGRWREYCNLRSICDLEVLSGYKMFQDSMGAIAL